MAADEGNPVPSKNMKKKLTDLEDLCDQHDKDINMLTSDVRGLQTANKDTGDDAKRLVDDLGNRIRAEFNELKEEMDHKFSLQTAENKRLQSHITNLKTENQALERRLVAMEKRVKYLESELVGEHDE